MWRLLKYAVILMCPKVMSFELPHVELLPLVLMLCSCAIFGVVVLSMCMHGDRRLM